MGTCLFIFKDYYKNWRGDKLELLIWSENFQVGFGYNAAQSWQWSSIALIMNVVLWPSINYLRTIKNDRWSQYLKWADAGTVGGGGTERRPNEESNSFSYLSKPAAAAMPVAKIETMESAKKIWTRNLFYRTFFPKMRGVLFLAPKATRTTFAKDTGTISRQGLTV